VQDPPRVPWHTTLRQTADLYAQISLAGYIASRRVARHSTAAHWATFYRNSDPGDFGVCQRVLRPFVSSKEELWVEVQRLRRATRALVRQPRVWAAITHLAEELLWTSTLEGEEIDLVLGGVQRILEGNALA
jgi:aminoglycoside phosphotransferase